MLHNELMSIREDAKRVNGHVSEEHLKTLTTERKSSMQNY